MKFLMDYDNIPGKGPVMLFKDNEDGTLSLATVEDVEKAIKEAVAQKDLLASQMREENLLLTQDYDFCRKEKGELLAENLVLRGALETPCTCEDSEFPNPAGLVHYEECFQFKALSHSPSESLSVVKQMVEALEKAFVKASMIKGMIARTPPIAVEWEQGYTAAVKIAHAYADDIIEIAKEALLQRDGVADDADH